MHRHHAAGRGVAGRLDGIVHDPHDVATNRHGGEAIRSVGARGRGPEEVPRARVQLHPRPARADGARQKTGADGRRVGRAEVAAGAAAVVHIIEDAPGQRIDGRHADPGRRQRTVVVGRAWVEVVGRGRSRNALQRLVRHGQGDGVSQGAGLRQGPDAGEGHYARGRVIGSAAGEGGEAAARAVRALPVYLHAARGQGRREAHGLHHAKGTAGPIVHGRDGEYHRLPGKLLGLISTERRDHIGRAGRYHIGHVAAANAGLGLPQRGRAHAGTVLHETKGQAIGAGREVGGAVDSRGSKRNTARAAAARPVGGAAAGVRAPIAALAQDGQVLQHRTGRVTVGSVAEHEHRAAGPAAAAGVVLRHEGHGGAAYVDGAGRGAHNRGPDDDDAAAGRPGAGKAIGRQPQVGRINGAGHHARGVFVAAHGAVVGGAAAAAAAHDEAAGRGLREVGPAEAAAELIRVPGVAAHPAAPGIGAAAATRVFPVTAGVAVGAAATGVARGAATPVTHRVAVFEGHRQQGHAHGVGGAGVEHRRGYAGGAGLERREIIYVVQKAGGAGDALGLVSARGQGVGMAVVGVGDATGAAEILARRAAEAPAGHVNLEAAEVERPVGVHDQDAPGAAVPARGRDVGRQRHIVVERHPNNLVAPLPAAGRRVGIGVAEGDGLTERYEARPGVVAVHGGILVGAGRKIAVEQVAAAHHVAAQAVAVAVVIGGADVGPLHLHNHDQIAGGQRRAGRPRRGGPHREAGGAGCHRALAGVEGVEPARSQRHVVGAGRDAQERGRLIHDLRRDAGGAIGAVVVGHHRVAVGRGARGRGHGAERAPRIEDGTHGARRVEAHRVVHAGAVEQRANGGPVYHAAGRVIDATIRDNNSPRIQAAGQRGA